MKRSRESRRPRNPLVAITRKLGQRIKTSAKTYRRKPKHRSRRSIGRGFAIPQPAY